MKKILLAIGAVALLSSCSGETKTVYVPATDAPTPITQPASRWSFEEQVFLDTVYEAYPSLEWEFGDEWMVDFGYVLCGALDEGTTLEELALMSVAEGADVEQVGYVLGAAVATFCPRHEWILSQI